jgi:hypothetical protein
MNGIRLSPKITQTLSLLTDLLLTDQNSGEEGCPCLELAASLAASQDMRNDPQIGSLIPGNQFELEMELRNRIDFLLAPERQSIKSNLKYCSKIWFSISIQTK